MKRPGLSDAVSSAAIGRIRLHGRLTGLSLQIITIGGIKMNQQAASISRPEWSASYSLIVLFRKANYTIHPV